MKLYTVCLNNEIYGQYDNCTDWKNGINAAIELLRCEGYRIHSAIAANVHATGFKNGKRVRVIGS